MELADVKTQLRTRDQKIKKLSEENAKLFDDKVVPTNKVIYQNNNNSNSSPDSLSVEHYKRQIRILEEKLKSKRSAVPVRRKRLRVRRRRRRRRS